MRIIEYHDRRSIERLLRPQGANDAALERRVRRIVDRVRDRGDRALVEYARRFDGVSPPLEVPPAEIRTIAARAAPGVRRALEHAAARIADVAGYQLPRAWKRTIWSGIVVEQRIEPLARV